MDVGNLVTLAGDIKKKKVSTVSQGREKVGAVNRHFFSPHQDFLHVQIQLCGMNDG